MCVCVELQCNFVSAVIFCLLYDLGEGKGLVLDHVVGGWRFAWAGENDACPSSTMDTCI